MVYKQTTPVGLTSGAQSPGMSDHLVRVGRLKQLQKDREWSDAELARQAGGRSPQQVRSWWTNVRLIGEKLARSLEDDLKLPRYWLDERPGEISRFETREGSGKYGGSVVQPSSAHGGTQVPILHWDQLPTMLAENNSKLLKTTPHLNTFAQASRAAKFVAMPDDSMAPVFQQGDHILFDPAEAPRAGDTVLISIPSGEHFIRTFRPKTAHAWDAAPLNPNYEPVSSQIDQAEVVAVMVEHRRYRRNS